MKKLQPCIRSFRLRTLPLSVSGILLGTLFAYSEGKYDNRIFLLAITTTLCLQILSNLANELGDALKGTDNNNRLGPTRSIQAGLLTHNDFRHLIAGFVILSLLSGTSLVVLSFRNLFCYKSLLLLLTGGVAILAALKYTLGKNPYGYRGLGDLFVFLFFGLLSTLGAYFLMTHTLSTTLLLPACSLGLLCAAVLNVNNIRDMENDKICGKYTLPVKIGEKNACIYHTCLITGALSGNIIYTALTYNGISAFLPLLTLPLFLIHLRTMWTNSGKKLDSQLKFLSLTTLTFSLLWGIGQH
ncbi:MAG: 1,4-dihydroxy-2-naphthoate octaprenyltransferase [Odoribacter sp.]|nr:1,4-dihydroxy-2-naphthoate octaprenyltransferase [Odoribacter sp.]